LIKRRLLQIGVGTVVFYVVFCMIAGAVIAEVALHPPRHRVTSSDEDQAPAWVKDDGASISEVNIAAADGVMLQAWSVRPEDANGDTVILLHGLKGNRLEMVNYADIFLAHGYSVLMPDARAHGNSGGDIATYGLLERDDIHRWASWVIANEHPGCVYGFGESMGAAQLLQSLAVESRFCAVIAECPFSTFRETSYDRIGQRFHTGPWLGRTVLRPIVISAFVYARLRYKVDMDRVSPEDAVAATRVPVLLIHGVVDTNIPVRHSRRIVAMNTKVLLWEVPDTGHSNAIDTSARELETRALAWFSNHRQSLPAHT
jgi:uncharacterized protein